VVFESLGERWAKFVDAARTIGQKYLVVNSVDRVSRTQPGIWRRAAERLNRAGEVCRAAGLQLGYHNHLFEFSSIEGTSQRPYDVLLESTNPSLVSMQMDLCWVIAAGQDPVAYLRRRPGRFSSVHVKDLKRRPVWTRPIRPDTLSGAFNQELTDVGRGVIEWPTLLAHCWSAGIRHYLVEHDSPSAPFDSATKSFGYLNRVRFSTGAR
jgi:sugar phosphate isomerase/epimerase